jgi:hypothetical protein
MKNIFCLEGIWYGDHRDNTSILPVLDILHRFYGIDFVHHRCATKEELIFALKRWKLKSFNKKYSILYLAFHGEENLISLGKEKITLQEISEIIEDKCEGVVIHIGSCLTLKIDKRKIQNFLESTKALAIMGYKETVDYMESTSFDLSLFNYMLSENLKLNRFGMKKLHNSIFENRKSQIKELGFRMEVNERSILKRKNQK